MIGLVGGGVDMSRLYLAQTRLQAACDAGSLMGRKVMAGGLWSDYSNRANTEAVRAFNANFETRSVRYRHHDQIISRKLPWKVTGTASVEVPMTLMKVFGQGSKQLT